LIDNAKDKTVSIIYTDLVGLNGNAGTRQVPELQASTRFVVGSALTHILFVQARGHTSLRIWGRSCSIY
jgi:hypothetical protein